MSLDYNIGKFKLVCVNNQYKKQVHLQPTSFNITRVKKLIEGNVIFLYWLFDRNNPINKCMRYVDFKEANDRILISNDTNILDVPIKYNEEQSSIVYCVALNKEELEQVNSKGVIYIKQPLIDGKDVSLIWESLLKADVMSDKDITDDDEDTTAGSLN